MYIYDTTEIAPLPLMLFGAGDATRGGRFFPIGADGRPRRTAEGRAAAAAELEALRARLAAAPQGVAREQLADEVELLEDGLGPAGGGDDEDVEVVRGLLEQSGGAYELDALSRLLSRGRPEIRDRIGKIRQWLEDNSEHFEVAKRPAGPVVALRPRPQRDDARLAADATAFYGVEEWVYFKAGDGAAALLEDVKVAIAAILGRRIADRALHSGGGNRGEIELLDAVAGALIEADRCTDFVSRSQHDEYDGAPAGRQRQGKGPAPAPGGGAW